ncbi:MAG: YkgJ family cysteine cluster protein [Desulfosoma sp.]|uniref:YkgJ family cysteine cluster protein n=1 Tax=Desulfosoma sp. TaxID=2603217 RepID=UPI00404914A4
MNAHDTPQNTTLADAQSPACWAAETLRDNVLAHVQELARHPENKVPAERVLLQLTQDTDFQAVLKTWNTLNGPDRVAAWKKVLGLAEHHAREILPACVQCGECCRQGSPTLYLEDVELLHKGAIPWNAVYTLRRGEPVRSPFQTELVFLLDERIKVREKPGTMECLFLDTSLSQCRIYADRPLQCRAQACWDAGPAEDLSKQPYLTRRDLFKDVELLMDVITEHDRRCRFDQLAAAFRELDATRGASVDQVLHLLAYEDHFRNFMAEKLNIPEDHMELVFGRSFAALVQVFGCRVRTEPDGTRVLVPDRDEASPSS